MSAVSIEKKVGELGAELGTREDEPRHHLPQGLKILVLLFYVLMMIFAAVVNYLKSLSAGGKLRGFKQEIAKTNTENGVFDKEINEFNLSKNRAETLKKWMATNVHAQGVMSNVVKNVDVDIAMDRFSFELASDREMRIQFRIFGSFENITKQIRTIIDAFKADGYTVLDVNQTQISGGDGMLFSGKFVIPQPRTS